MTLVFLLSVLSNLWEIALCDAVKKWYNILYENFENVVCISVLWSEVCYVNEDQRYVVDRGRRE